MPRLGTVPRPRFSLRGLLKRGRKGNLWCYHGNYTLSVFPRLGRWTYGIHDGAQMHYTASSFDTESEAVAALTSSRWAQQGGLT